MSQHSISEYRELQRAGSCSFPVTVREPFQSQKAIVNINTDYSSFKEQDVEFMRSTLPSQPDYCKLCENPGICLTLCLFL